MSDAMTNREIEDVLTSIRRLVAQDGARTADRIPENPAVEGRPAPRPTGRLILTDAQRIDPAPPPASDPAPAPAVPPGPDLGRLEATIAELEAAVSASGGTWDPDTADEAPRLSNVTELYGRLSFAPRPGSEVATPAVPVTEAVAEAPAAEAEPEPEEVAVVDIAGPASADAGDVRIAPIAPAPPSVDRPAAEAVFEVPPLAEAAEDTGEAFLDEAGLQALVAQIVRDELHGQLGERITAQVRKLVRAEIAKALDERKFL